MDLPEVSDERLTRIVRGLARNPSAPADVVWRLTRRPATAREVARRQDITEELAYALLALDDADTARNLGDNDRTPVAVRIRLVSHRNPAVRMSAVRDAPDGRLPPGLWRRLAADPDYGVRKHVAGHGSTPDEVRARLAADPHHEVRRAVADRWTALPESVHRALLTDGDAGVRAAAVSPWHPAPPADLHEALLADDLARQRVVPHAELSSSRLAEWAASPDDNTRAALAGHPDLPATVRDRLAGDADVEVRIGLVLNRNTPEEMRTRLLADLDAETDFATTFIVRHHLGNAWRDKASLGWLWAGPLPQRLAYLESPHYFFRMAVAASGDLPQHAVDRLMADPEIAVRQIVARCHDVPGPALERLVREHGDVIHLRPLLVERPSFPPDAFVRLAESGEARIRYLATFGKDLPAEVVGRLAADPELFVRRAAAAHPRVPVHCLPALLTDDDPDVAEAAGAAPSLPVDWCRRLLDRAGVSP